MPKKNVPYEPCLAHLSALSKPIVFVQSSATPHRPSLDPRNTTKGLVPALWHKQRNKTTFHVSRRVQKSSMFFSEQNCGLLIFFQVNAKKPVEWEEDTKLSRGPHSVQKLIAAPPRVFDSAIAQGPPTAPVLRAMGHDGGGE